MKAFAGRERDWADVESVLIRQQGKLAWKTILGELRPLLEVRETPEQLEILLKLKERVRKGA